MSDNCILCGDQNFIKIPGSQALKFVTSDCQLTASSCLIKICSRCGHIQKDINQQWLAEVKEIYAGYAPYLLSEGRDQLIFDGLGAQNLRSYHILKQFFSEYPLPDKGAILDVGCGNGELLAAFNSLYPEWEMAGFEIEEHQREKVIDKKRGTSFFHGDIGNIEGEFDLITLFNVFEHISEPNALLSNLRARLKENGRLLIYVPNIKNSLFDLLVFDHCSHFEQGTLGLLLRINGFQGTFHACHPFGRYLFIAATPADKLEGVPYNPGAAGNAKLVKRYIHILGQIIDQARSLDTGEGIGVFGTTIAGTWVAGALNESVRFFVDEDARKTGKTHQDKPIFQPGELPEQVKVFLAFISHEAGAIKERLEGEYQKVKFIAPNYA